ncbi:MAG: recombination mediator RecR [Phototrophicaceae bacterium]|jgi:recombination protein RecR
MSKAVPAPITDLIQAFSRLPGIGPKSASRLAYYLLRAPDDVALNLADALRELKTGTLLCSVCFNITVESPCPICGDYTREQDMVAVVEEPLDVLAIERTGMYRGVYHVLHGAISPVNGVGPNDLKIDALVKRVEQQGIREVIIATNPGMEGDATAMYLQRSLDGKGVKMTRLARGLPVGGDIEYVDSVTLARALQGRNEV